MTFEDWVIAILAILCLPLEIIWKMLCIVPGILAFPVCVLLDYVEHKCGNKGYAATGMTGAVGRLSSIPRMMFTRIFGLKDDEMASYLKKVQDFEEKGL